MKISHGLLLSTALVSASSAPALALKTTSYLITPRSDELDIKSASGAAVGKARYKYYTQTVYDKNNNASTVPACSYTRNFINTECKKESVDVQSISEAACKQRALASAPSKCGTAKSASIRWDIHASHVGKVLQQQQDLLA